MDRFRDKEDEETPLPILPSGSRGITVMEADITTLRLEVISVHDDNDPGPEKFMQSGDVFPTPSSLTFGFHGIDPWRQSDNFPVGKARQKMTRIPSIYHMSRLKFFMKLYLMDYIKDVFIPETNKCLNSAMNLSEYFRVIGCRLIMACCVGHSFREFFLEYPITPHKGSPIRLNHIISGRRLENITQVMSYKNIAIPGFNYPFFQQRQMQEGWNKNMAAIFYPSWVSVLGESIY